MKILFINDYGYFMGGAEQYAFSLARALTELGHEVRWLTSRSRGGGPLALKPKSAIAFHQDYFFEFPFDGQRWQRAWLQWSNPVMGSRLAKVLAEFKPEVVHLHGFLGRCSADILRQLEKYPTLATLHTYKAICPKGTKQLPDGTLCEAKAGKVCQEKKCLSRVEYWHAKTLQLKSNPWLSIRLALAPSEYLRKTFQRENIPVPVIHFPYGTDIHRFRKKKQNGHGKILYAGRLSPGKGVEFLLQSFASLIKKIPQAQLWIAGTGPEETRLKAMAANISGSQIQFLGDCDRETLSRWHSEVDLAVVPSTWPENSSVSLLESLALGTPPVATRVGGTPELFQNGGEGFLVSPQNSAELTDAIFALLSHPKLRRQMEENCLQRAESLHLAAHSKELVNIYDVLRLKDCRA